jgi:MerR family transcriptional regulator, light-induced transcriptional regulator
LRAERDRLSSAYVELALAGDRARALATVLDPLRAGAYDLAALHDEVLGPAAARIGDLWHAGAITVADEHFATRLTEEAIVAARGIGGRMSPARGRRIVLACPADEQHELGLRMLGEVLSADGWDVRLLGAATPAAALAAHVRKVEPAIVALTCATPIAISSLILAVETLRRADPDLPIVLGGRAAVQYPAVGVAAGATAVYAGVAEAREGLPSLLATAATGR